jgi:S-adenosylmethionine:tRNA ribosyltransferase-isomerase
LTIGRNKRPEIINPIGKEIAEKNGIKFFEANFKKQDGAAKGNILSKKYNLYRQHYCGCEFSLPSEKGGWEGFIYIIKSSPPLLLRRRENIMKLELFDYNLPKELIAAEPASPRDAARLLAYDRKSKKCVHEKFYNIGKFLKKGDVLVLNDTKVIPARLIGRRVIASPVLGARQSHQLGRKFKILLLEKKISPHSSLLRSYEGQARPSFKKRETGDIWTCLIDGKGRQDGLKIFFGNNHNFRGRGSYGRRGFGSSGLCGEIIKKIGGGIWEIKFNKSGKELDKIIFKLGEMPLPPYIKQAAYLLSKFDAVAPNFADKYKQKNKDWYQTVFATYSGSVAAPTAGLHFTSRLLAQLKKRGIKIEYITLHVGMGTFMPVKTEKIEEHKMHRELAIVSPKTAAVLNKAKKEGRRIVACGTTAARTLESFAASVIPVPYQVRDKAPAGIQKKNIQIPHPHSAEASRDKSRDRQMRDDAGGVRENTKGDGYFIRAGKKYTDIFIYPPYKFKFIDALITNFHLPKSTLLMLASAFLSEGDAKGIKILKNLYEEATRKKYRFYSYGDAMLII